MIKPGDVLLRPAVEADVDRLLTWRNADRVRANMYSDHIISSAEHKNWYSRILQDSSCDYRVCEHLGRPVGLVAFSDIDKRNGHAYWAFYIGEPDVPKGCGAAMECLALDHAFNILRLRKLCCEVLSFNARVIKMHKRFGFQQEGLLVAHMLKNNQYEDVVVLALFGSAWPQIRERVSAIIFGDTIGEAKEDE